MKVYIAGPMSGHPNNNEEMFRHAAKCLRAAGHEVTVPHEMDDEQNVDLSRDATPEEYEQYMERDLAALQGQHAVVFLPGWQLSGGAGREGREAIRLGLRLYTWLPGWPGKLWSLPDWFFRTHSTTERVSAA